MEDSPGTSNWTLLGKDLWDRFFVPWKHPSFLWYFLGGVVLFGGLGVWFELIDLFGQHSPNPDAPLRTALLSTFPAILGPACMQIMWSDAAKYLKTFATAVLIGGIALAIVYARPIVADATAVHAYSWLTAASMLVWWLANAYQKEFHDIDAPTGGNPDRQLPGDLSGLKH